jgi:hypothetical protein
MSKRGRSLGMKITHPSDLCYMSPPIWNTSKLEKFFREMKDRGNGLVIVVIPDGVTYGKGQIVLLKYSSMLVSVLFLILTVKPLTPCLNQQHIVQLGGIYFLTFKYSETSI